jgi:hypothetical protein
MAADRGLELEGRAAAEVRRNGNSRGTRAQLLEADLLEEGGGGNGHPPHPTNVIQKLLPS